MSLWQTGDVVGPTNLNAKSPGGFFAKTLSAAAYPKGISGNIANDNAVAVNAAVAAAPGLGMTYVEVPATHQPFNANLVTFNNSLRMVAEGYDPSEWNVRAYGAAGDGTTDDQIAIMAAINAASANAIFVLKGNVVKFPAGQYRHTATIQVPIALNQGQVILRGDGMRTTYLLPAGPSTNFTAAPLYNACLLFGSATPDAAGTTTNVTQYCGLENMSTSGTLITSGSVVAVQFTQMQKGWIINHIIEQFPNNSIGLYLRGSTVTGGLGANVTAPHCWRNSFSNCVVSVGSNNLGGRPVVLQNADENYFENCVHAAPVTQTVASDSLIATLIQMGRNNIFVDCLQAGERTALKTGYVGMKFGPPVNEAGVPNGSVLSNCDYGAVMEGFDICVWFGGDSSGNTLGNCVLNSNPSIFNIAYRDDNPALTNGGFVGGGNGGNIYEAPLVGILYRAVASSVMPSCLFIAGQTTPSIGGSDIWSTNNVSLTTITDFLAPSNASLDGRPLTIRFNDSVTVIRDVLNGGGGHIRNWGRLDIAGLTDQVVNYRNIAGIWYQTTPVMNISNLTTNLFTIPSASAFTDGTILAPALTFTSETSLGFFRSGASAIGVSGEGRLQVGSGAVFSLATQPEYGFGGEPQMGMRRSGASQIWFGSTNLRFGVFGASGNAGFLGVEIGSANTPGIQWNAEPKLGLFRSAASHLDVSAGTLNLNQAFLSSVKTATSVSSTNLGTNAWAVANPANSGASICININGVMYIFSSSATTIGR